MIILRLAIIALCLFLSGCGSAYVSSSATGISGASTASGVYVDDTYYELLEKEFKDAAACTGLDGEFWDVAVVLLPPPNFPCIGDNNKGKVCYGEFAMPNRILLADRLSWKHEVIHYLLYKNKGDLDPNHESELFKTCPNT